MSLITLPILLNFWHNSGATTLTHAISALIIFLKISGKPNNYQFYLPNFLKFCHNISHKLLRPTQYLEKLPEILELTHFAEINPPPTPCCSILAE